MSLTDLFNNRFAKVFDNTKTIVLNYNYRNPKNLVVAASKLISKNSYRFYKDIKSTADEGMICINGYENAFSEAKDIIKRINLLHKQGAAFDEIAILYRNHSI